MTGSEIKAVFADLQYKDWTFDVHFTYLNETSLQPYPWFRVAFSDIGTPWTGRKWHLSYHMTKDEIVQTALKAVLAAEEHEAREKFLYKGRAIFGPHYDVEALVKLIDQGAQVPREDNR